MAMTKIVFIILFIIFSIIIDTLLNYDKKSRIESVLNEKTKQINLEYGVIYKSYANLSRVIFDSKVNTKEIVDLFGKRDRVQLFKHLTEDYKKLQEYSVKQLHFHLPNNDSFLRMHRPKKFGDSLTKARQTVKYVNEHKKPIDGFEEGKIYNGFRFVYPMFKDSKHIGSVEVSFSADFFIKEITDGYKVYSDFFIKEDVVNTKVFKEELSNYMKSPLTGYLYEKSFINHKTKDEKYIQEFKKLEKEILESFKNSKAFSTYLRESFEIVTFIPIKNPISKKAVAWLKINSFSKSVSRIELTKNMLSIMLIALLGLILFIIYKQLIFQGFLQLEVDKKTKELNSFNAHLQEAIQIELEKNKKHQEIMIAQSRHAAMGEMISMIAHQWRQPLSAISMTVSNIIVDVELDTVENETLKKESYRIISLVEELSKTIDDFRDFFKPGIEMEEVFIKNIFDDLKSVMGTSINNNINLHINLNPECTLVTYHRELMQVLINIVKNSKDSFGEKDLEDKDIFIKVEDKKETIEIEICDNAGGIENDILDRIFEPYFTTKNEYNGTGLGLYISKVIIEQHLKGTIEVNNIQKGVCFKIVLPRFESTLK